MRIGSQTLDVVFDTGSSESWVLTSAIADQDCPSVGSYLSDEQYDGFTIDYGGGRVTCRVARRTILHLIASAPHLDLTVPPMWMGYVDRDSVVLDEIRADGVVGLGMEALQHQWTLSASPKGIESSVSSGDDGEQRNGATQRPWLLELLAESRTAVSIVSARPPVFSIFISPALHREEHPGLQLILGGVDPDLVSRNSTWHFFPVIPCTHNGAGGYGFWVVRLCSLSLGNQLLLPGREESAEPSK